VDLWILGNRNAREIFPHWEAEVTLLWQKPKTALEPDTLLRFEVEDAFVLHDPKGHFRKVRMRFWKTREALRGIMLNDTAHVIKDLTLKAQRQTPEQSVALLREAARRAAAMRIYLDFGWRAPKWRHFDAHIARSALKHLRVIQAFPEEAGPWRTLIRYMRAHQLQLRELRERPGFYPPPLPSLEKVQWLSKKGHREGAILLIRQALENLAHGEKDVASSLALWRIVQGFDQRPPRPGEIRRLAIRCAKLIRALKIEQEIDSRWNLAERLDSF
jgi:hypothetical protein